GGTADRNRSHWSTSKTPSYTKSVSWQHHPDFLEKTGYVKRTDSREDRRAKKISLTSEGMFFIQRLTLAQSMYLKEIWDYLTHDEQELFEVINKKLLAHFSDASS
ncbi:hypothetical protein SNA85_18200, partial [Escherichia coli]|nr:hypothetical protein [Escherichia coli]MDZ8703544.1 hypothetical protein [Escherichia coli]MDZ9838153.1 hypothetical protein [Escherichia coli]